MPKAISVNSIEEIKEILKKVRDEKKILGKETIHVSLEDYVSRANGDFLHEPYISFSTIVSDPHTKKSVVYLYRQRLFLPGYLPFGKYSLNDPETEFTRSFVDDIIRTAQQLLNSYFIDSEPLSDFLLGLNYEMHTEKIKVKMQKTEQKI